MWLKLIFFIICCKFNAEGANILGIFHNPSRSHFQLGNTLLEALAIRGHNVTFLTPFPVQTDLKNYRIIFIDGLQSIKDETIVNICSPNDTTFLDKFFTLKSNFQKINTKFFDHPKLKRLLDSKAAYDVVILDWVFNDHFLGFAHHFGASSIVFSSFGTSSLINKITGNSAPSSYVPNILPAASDEMTFSSRFFTTLSVMVHEITQIFDIPRQNSLLHAYFPTAPHVKTLITNVSLVFVNNHFTIETPRPYVPNMVQIGGFHIREPTGLGGELKSFMDQATEGVLYFSLGSIIRGAQIDDEKLQLLMRTFAKLPLKVLWKFDGSLPNLPPNVRTEKWLPQTDILAHPNTRIFITQGGILSLSEALYFGIPIIGMPFLGDQEINVEVGVSKGYALRLNFRSLTEEVLTDAIRKMLNDPKYKLNAKERSEWFRDRPMKPLDKAIYWVEYVIRYRGAHHLKAQGVKLPWYQFYLVDVILLMATIGILVITISFVTFKFVKTRLTNLFKAKLKVKTG